MRFWDSSALIPLLVREAPSAAAVRLIAEDGLITAWWGTETECVSAICRVEREGRATASEALEALGRLAGYAAGWQEVQPSQPLRRSAARLLRVHPLRAADALQLAAALQASDGNPPTLWFVTGDVRLADAARREGFPVLVPGVRD